MMMSSQWQWWWPFLCLMDPSVEQIEQWPNQRGQWSDLRFLSSSFLDFDESFKISFAHISIWFWRSGNKKNQFFSLQILQNLHVSLLSSKMSTHPDRLDIVKKTKLSNESLEINGQIGYMYEQRKPDTLSTFCILFVKFREANKNSQGFSFCYCVSS